MSILKHPSNTATPVAFSRAVCARRPFSLSLLALSITTALTGVAVAAETAVPTSADRELSPVVVTATRTATRLDDVINDITVLDRSDIDRAAGLTLPQLLAQQPGVQYVDNGGLGKASSIYIRGAEARHTLLLIDGVPYGSATLGTPSFDYLPISQIDHIEILRGPASALYGSDAIGGVIQIFTRKADAGDKSLHPSFFAGMGTYGQEEISAGLSGAGEVLAANVYLSQINAKGFDVFTTGKHDPDADGFQSSNLGGQLRATVAPGHVLSLAGFTTHGYSQGDSGLTPNVHTNFDNYAFSLSSSNQISDIWTSVLRWSRNRDHATYVSGSYVGPTFTDQRQISWENTLQTSLGTVLLGIDDTNQHIFSSTAYTANQRDIRSFFGSYLGHFGNHRLQLAARRDDNSQYGIANTGTLSYGYKISPQWQVNGSVGTGFKAPSFNQLYYPYQYGYVGNAKLQPERSNNQEISLNWHDNVHHVSLTRYDNQIKDAISYASITYNGSAATTWVNIDKASILGTTLSYDGQYDAWHWAASYDDMKPRDNKRYHLARRADTLLNASIGYRSNGWSLNGEVNHSGYRYNTVNNGTRIPGYSLLNLSATYALSKDWQLEGRINNLQDRQYEVISTYATAGRNVFVGVRYQPQ